MLRIFTDTAANVPPHLLEQYHITAMPLTYLLDGGTFEEPLAGRIRRAAARHP